jgi:hypothetical protein
MPSISRLGGATDATLDTSVEDQVKAQNPEVDPDDIETVVVSDRNVYEDEESTGRDRYPDESKEGEESSPGNSSSPSDDRTQSSPEKKLRENQSHARTTASPTVKDQTGRSTVPSTDTARKK